MDFRVCVHLAVFSDAHLKCRAGLCGKKGDSGGRVDNFELVFADRLDVVAFLLADIAHLQLAIFDAPADEIVRVFDVDVDAKVRLHLSGGERNRVGAGSVGWLGGPHLRGEKANDCCKKFVTCNFLLYKCPRFYADWREF